LHHVKVLHELTSKVLLLVPHLYLWRIHETRSIVIELVLAIVEVIHGRLSPQFCLAMCICAPVSIGAVLLVIEELASHSFELSTHLSSRVVPIVVPLVASSVITYCSIIAKAIHLLLLLLLWLLLLTVLIYSRRWASGSILIRVRGDQRPRPRNNESLC